jgi:nucleoside-diphosphate-sugar epimerase
MEKLHVVLGANGSAGNAIVRELARQGKKVRAVVRNTLSTPIAGVEVVKGDVTNPESVRKVTESASVVYHAAQPAYYRWREEFPPMNEAIIAGLSGSGAKLVFVDNLYMYGKPDGAMTENSPLNATTHKGKVRIELANRLLEVHKSGALRVVIGRGADYFGPGVGGSAVGDFLFDALVKGKKGNWPLKIDLPHSLTYIDDYARGLILLGENDFTDGQVWHIPAITTTGREFLYAAFEEAQLPAKIGVLNFPMMWLAGRFVKEAKEMLELDYQFNAPFVTDSSKFQKAFPDFRTTPLREALRPTIAYYRAKEHAAEAKAAA